MGLSGTVKPACMDASAAVPIHSIKLFNLTMRPEAQKPDFNMSWFAGIIVEIN
jgi:hypothetical protein